MLAETLSKAAQAEAQRDLEVRQADYAAAIARQKAQADRAYDIQSSITQQKQVEEQTKVSIIQKQQEVKVQQAEAERRAAELVATIQRQAEAESERIRILAEAEQRRAVIGAEGSARAVRLQAEADAVLHRLHLLQKHHADEQFLARRQVRALPAEITRLERRPAG